MGLWTGSPRAASRFGLARAILLYAARVSILDSIGNTPLVPLARLARGLPVPVLAKCEHMNPGGSVKDRLALAIVDDAERRGAIAPGATLIEATAGNTG